MSNAAVSSGCLRLLDFTGFFLATASPFVLASATSDDSCSKYLGVEPAEIHWQSDAPKSEQQHADAQHKV
jgi:hypothetical protein